MTRALVFTFRTFPHLDELNAAFKDVFVFGKLKKDLLRFQEIIKQKQPDLIIGIAQSTDSFSVFEQRAVNFFHGRKLHGRDSYVLFIPEECSSTWLSNRQTTSFCNLVAYRLAEYLSESGSKCKLALSHVLPSDINYLAELLRKDSYN